MKNTLIVNLFAGPGAGKSTGATYIFAKLKMAGIDCEYVSEYAKDRVWQDDQFPLQHCQLYVIGKQCLKIERLLGKVDVIITATTSKRKTKYVIKMRFSFSIKESSIILFLLI